MFEIYDCIAVHDKCIIRDHVRFTRGDRSCNTLHASCQFVWRLLARRCLGLGLGVGSPRLNYSDSSAILGYTATLFRRIFNFPHACQIQLDTNLSTTTTSTMKLSAAIALTAVGGAAAFTATPSSIRTSSALNMGGFLEGKGKKITVREDEDAAMWFDDGAGGRTPSEKPKKEPVKKEPKKSGGFKFPWDK